MSDLGEMAKYIATAVTVNLRVTEDIEGETNATGETVFTFSDGLVLTLTADKKVKVSITDEAYQKALESIAQKELLASSAVKFDKYATTYGTVAMVRYENGTTFILNYNDYSIVCELDGVKYTLPSYSFATIKDGTVYNYNKTTKDAIVVVVNGTEKTVDGGASAAIN